MSEEKALHIWTIYQKTKDFPNSIVARRYDVMKDQVIATDNLIIGQELEQVRDLLPPGLTKIMRAEGDDQTIIESWI